MSRGFEENEEKKKLQFFGELGLLVSLPLEGKVAAQPTDEV